MAAYAAVSGVALAFPHRPPAWPLLALAHLALILGPLRAAVVRPVLDGVTRATPRLAAFVSDWYPLLLVPFVYTELQTLNVAVWGGEYFDPVVLGWEQALWGGQPSTTLAYALPSRLLSEILHSAYLAYYLIIYLPFLALYVSGRRGAFRTMLLAIVVGFAVHYLAFIYFPVLGPRYLFPAPGGPASEAWAYGFAHTVLEAGSSRGAAFPSSHAAIATIQAVMTAGLMSRATALVVGVTAALLCLGAVYGGFHYGVDILTGAALGLVIGIATLRARPADP